MSKNAAPPPLLACKIPRFAWLIWCGGAALILFLNIGLIKSGGAYALGRTIGLLAGFFLFPALVGWIAWRIARRSPRAAPLGFLITAGLLLLAQISQAVDRGWRQPSMREAAGGLENGAELASGQQQPILDRTRTALSRMAGSPNGDEREMALAMRAYTSWVDECWQKHSDAIGALNLDHFFDLDEHATVQLRAEKTTAINKLRDANAQLRHLVGNGSAWIKKELQRRNLSPANIQIILTGFAETNNPDQPALIAMLDSYDSFAEILSDFESFAEEYEGQWSKDSETGTLILPDEGAIKYNALLARVTATLSDLKALQRQMAARKLGQTR